MLWFFLIAALVSFTIGACFRCAGLMALVGPLFLVIVTAQVVFFSDLGGWTKLGACLTGFGLFVLLALLSAWRREQNPGENPC